MQAKSNSTLGNGSPVALSTLTVKTEADFQALSYYTLCRLQDTTGYNPIKGLPVLIARGQFVGELTVDRFGNFVSFR